MSVDRTELHKLLDALSEDELPLAEAYLRRQAKRRASAPKFDWIGMITDGPEDASSPERIDAELARGFGRR